MNEKTIITMIGSHVACFAFGFVISKLVSKKSTDKLETDGQVVACVDHDGKMTEDGLYICLNSKDISSIIANNKKVLVLSIKREVVNTDDFKKPDGNA